MLTNSNVDKTYVKIFNGQFAVETTQDDPDAQKRITKSGREVYEVYYNEITGIINEINETVTDVDGDVFRYLMINLESSAGYFQIRMPRNSQPALMFYHVMESIVPGKPVVISLSKRDKETKLFLSQDGNTMKWNYTRDNPGERPEWEWIEETGDDGAIKKKPNKNKQILWFLSKLPKLNERFAARHRIMSTGGDFDPPAGPETENLNETNTDDLSDDLPF